MPPVAQRSMQNLVRPGDRPKWRSVLESVGSTWLKLAVTVSVLTAIYVLTGPGNRTEADDAFGFAYLVEHGSLRQLLTADHLLFLPFSRGILNLLRLLHISIDAYDAMRLISCLVAAVSIVLFGFVLRRRFRLSLFAAISGAAGLAVSYGLWRYANEAEVYALVVLSICVLCLVGFSELRSTWTVIAAGLIGALVALVHILGVIPAIMLIPLVLLGKHRVRDTVIYLLAFALFAGVGSYAAYRYVNPSDRGFVGYLLAQDPGSSYDVQAVPQSILSLGQDVATGNFVFAYPAVARRLVTALPAQYLAEEQYMGERADAVVRAVPLITIPLLILLAIYLVLSVRRHAGESGLARGVRPLLAAVVFWIVAYWLIVIGPSSSAPEAWIPLLPAVWVVAAVVVFERMPSRRGRSLVVALLLVLLVHNVAGGFWMMHSRSTDYNAVKAAWLLDHARVTDVILTADGPVFERYLRYYAAAKVVNLEGLRREQLAVLYAMSVRKPGRVFATAGVLDPPSQLRIADLASFRDLEQFAARVRPDFRIAAHSNVGDVYVRR